MFHFWWFGLMVKHCLDQWTYWYSMPSLVTAVSTVMGDQTSHRDRLNLLTSVEWWNEYQPSRVHGKAQCDGHPVLFFTVCEPKYCRLYHIARETLQFTRIQLQQGKNIDVSKLKGVRLQWSVLTVLYRAAIPAITALCDWLITVALVRLYTSDRSLECHIPIDSTGILFQSGDINDHVTKLLEITPKN